MTKATRIRLMLVLAIAYDLEAEKTDVKTTFLNGELKEEISKKQPELRRKGFMVEGREDMVFQLKISIWIEEVPRQWYQWLNKYVAGQGFIRSDADHCACFRQQYNHFVILGSYVDNNFD